jgi:hypothetical protein
MKRLLTLALAALAVTAGAASTTHASAFGLFYSSTYCRECSVCIRPFNAFSPVSCGVVDQPPQYKLPGLGCCGGWFKNCCFDGDCGGCGGCGTRGCGRNCGLGGKCCAGSYDDGGAGAFGFSNPMRYSGIAGGRGCGGYGCGGYGGGLAWGDGCTGHAPPPGPPVMPPANVCGLWFAPKPMPGVYGVAGGYPMYYPAPATAAVPAPAAPAAPAAVKPVSYQQAYPMNAQPAGWYMGYPVWFVPGYGFVIGQ